MQHQQARKPEAGLGWDTFTASSKTVCLLGRLLALRPAQASQRAFQCSMSRAKMAPWRSDPLGLDSPVAGDGSPRGALLLLA